MDPKHWFKPGIKQGSSISENKQNWKEQDNFCNDVTHSNVAIMVLMACFG